MYFSSLTLAPTPTLPMALTRIQKSAQLKELEDKFASSQSVIFAHYIGLTVAEVSELRKKLRAAGAEMKVGKKTLMRIAAKNKGLPIPEEKDLPGPIAWRRPLS